VNKGELKIFDGNGYYKLYNKNMQLSKDGVFKNYKLIDGKDYIYNKDGILISIQVFKNGFYVGDAPLEENK
jgi:antitoxin component YwqK of YwqJK toxin-antitoxin module